MARPKKFNAEYFSHDADMRNDSKIKAVRRRFGLKGYAVWNMILELLTDTDYFEYEWNDLNIELAAGDFDIEPEELKQIIEYFLQLELLQLENNKIMSLRHKNRLNTVLLKRKHSFSGVSAPQTTHIKVKESKVNKKKEEERKEKEIKENEKTEIAPAKFAKQNVASAKSAKQNVANVANVAVSVSDSVSDSVIGSGSGSGVGVENVIEKEIVKENFNFKKELLKIGFKENLVNEWLAVRKTKRATNTQTAFNKFMEQVNKCKADKNSILELCVEKSWMGFKAEWYENSKNKLPFGEALTAAHRYAFPPKQIANG
jgi:hypothetical protein